MNTSLLKRIALIFVLVSISTGILIGFIVNSVITNRVVYETQERVKEALNTARWVYTSKLSDIDRTIRLTSIRYILREALRKEKAISIKDDISRIMKDEGLDFLTLVDRKGTVLLRFHHPEMSGDNLTGDPFVKEALKNNAISGTQVLSREELLKEGRTFADQAAFSLVPTPKEKQIEALDQTSGMVLKSAYPVVGDNQQVLGVLMGGILLNRRYEIVDRIKNIVFRDAKYRGKEIGTATIFLGEWRISTNVMDKEGRRAVGTRAMREVQEQVLQNGLPWMQRAYVVDDWYITAYEPIRDFQNNIVGMLYVGILESKYTVLKEKLILLFMLGMLVAVAISSFLSIKMIKKEFWQNIKSDQNPESDPRST
ncbi:MAG: cache domain-containing protein [Thermodesulfobacteriota bacterium]